MAEITEIINTKLKEFKDHTENLLGLVKELGDIKKESNETIARIKEGLGRIERIEETINDFQRHMEQLFLKMAAISEKIDDAFRRLQSLQDTMDDIQKNTDNLFENIIQDVRRFMEDQKREIATKMDKGLKEIKSYAEESRKMLSHEITDFLNKQTALVGNLTQQIDSCQRAINIFKVDPEKHSLNINELKKENDLLREDTKQIKENDAKITNEIRELRTSNAALRQDLDTLKAKFADTEFVKKFSIGWVLTRKV